jgi:hypothetical protein
MAPKIVFYFIILLFIERFHEGNLDVMISLFLSLCESLGNKIMFVFLFLHGGEWCELWIKGSNATTKGTQDFKLINTLINFVWIMCYRICIYNG